MFVYLSLVNVGVNEVVRRLKNPGLFMLSAVGTVLLLSLGIIRVGMDAQPLIILCVAAANLVLFTFFLIRLPHDIADARTARISVYFLFLSIFTSHANKNIT